MGVVSNPTFKSEDSQPGTCKSRHVMKEFLRKRDSIRRQNQLAARSQSRVLPWLRREDMVRSSEHVDDFGEDTGAASESSFESISTATSPQHSHRTCASTAFESRSSLLLTSSAPANDNVNLRRSPNSSEVRHKHQELLDYLFRVVIRRISGTNQFCNISSPATTVARHILNRPLPAQFLLATSSLSRDLDSGRRSPTSETIGLMLNGIRMLKERINTPAGLSEEIILAMVNLWMYEAVLTMDVVDDGPEREPTQGRQLPKVVPGGIQTHIDGLERSISLLGGLKSLSPVTVSLLAWCTSTLPGYSTIDMRTTYSSHKERRSTASNSCFARLLDRLTKIQILSTATCGSQPSSFIHEAVFTSLRRTLLRLTQTSGDQRTPMRRLMRSASSVSILLFIFDILLGGSDTALREPKERRNELMQAQARLIEHNLDKDGSPEKAWQVLLYQADTPHSRLHSRTWSIVEMVNVVKQLKGSTIDAVSRLLLNCLLPETREESEESTYGGIVLQIHHDLDCLANLS
ncbi:hypothetical protein EDD37DRAFT_607996 [Exophiala viscosa]|uniref:uncharacterized protein n=1 Tax=Exophiala viscosa TaxID=2486360 RepID=UPI00218CDA63|nr:hypothetical protein EDD37DRAFT_607996 [Exophiala viscosa]